MELKIKLTTQKDVMEFVNAISKIPGNFDLRHGNYVVDAKSVMGILSLNLQDPVTLVCHDYDETIDVKLERWLVA